MQNICRRALRTNASSELDIEPFLRCLNGPYYLVNFAFFSSIRKKRAGPMATPRLEPIHEMQEMQLSPLEKQGNATTTTTQ
jgi:hypothetical protein